MAVRVSPLVSHSVVPDFISVYHKIMKGTVLAEAADPRRILSLRPSQLPFCAPAFFVENATRGLTRAMDMPMAYYVNVGSTVHEVMQRYLGMSGRFLADWECPVCGKWRRLSHEPECCDRPSKYHEVEINYKGVVGHIDAIFKDRQGNYWILDFKTTSSAAAPKKQKDPGRVYIEQIEAYALFLKLQYGITVKGVILAFIKRDNPNTPVLWSKTVSEVDLKAIRKRFKIYRSMHRDALDVRSKSEALDLLEYGKCTNPDCKVCTKGKAFMKQAVLQAYKKAKANHWLPLRAMAENALAEQMAERAKSKRRSK